MDRYLPAAVRRVLRTEVGFACPMPLCASPYLTYHHFDPPWSKRASHDPNGMIALCLPHHKEADAGTYTVEQLRALKSNLKNRGPVSGTFNWRREITLFVAGGLYFLNCPIILKSEGRPLVWLSKSEDGFDLLNFDLFSAAGTLVFSMRDNEWDAVPTMDDIEALPSGHSLSIRSKKEGIFLNMAFRAMSPIDLRRTIFEQTLGHFNRPATPKSPLDVSEESAALVADGIIERIGDVKGSVLMCEVSCDLQWPVDAKLGTTCVHFPAMDLDAGWSFIHDAVVGLKIDKDRFAIGQQR